MSNASIGEKRSPPQSSSSNDAPVANKRPTSYASPASCAAASPLFSPAPGPPTPQFLSQPNQTFSPLYAGTPPPFPPWGLALPSNAAALPLALPPPVVIHTTETIPQVLARLDADPKQRGVAAGVRSMVRSGACGNSAAAGIIRAANFSFPPGSKQCAGLPHKQYSQVAREDEYAMPSSLPQVDGTTAMAYFSGTCSVFFPLTRLVL